MNYQEIIKKFNKKLGPQKNAGIPVGSFLIKNEEAMFLERNERKNRECKIGSPDYDQCCSEGHAEQLSIKTAEEANFTFNKDTKLFVNILPCIHCLKKIINKEIKTVYYIFGYKAEKKMNDYDNDKDLVGWREKINIERINTDEIDSEDIVESTKLFLSYLFTQQQYYKTIQTVIEKVKIYNEEHKLWFSINMSTFSMQMLENLRLTELVAKNSVFIGKKRISINNINLEKYYKKITKALEKSPPYKEIYKIIDKNFHLKTYNKYEEEKYEKILLFYKNKKSFF